MKPPVVAIAVWFVALSAAADNPAIEAALALPRTEPTHHVQAIVALLDLGATDQANTIAEELAGLELTDQQLAELVSKAGAARLTRVARAAPTTSDVVSRALAAAHAAATSDERLQGLVDRLAGPRDDAIEAIRALRLTGRAGAEFCVAQIAASGDPQVRARLREALVALAPISLPLLYNATADANPNVRTEAAYALGRLAELGRLRSQLPAALVAREALTGSPAARWAFLQLSTEPLTIDTATALIRRGVDQLTGDEKLFLSSDASQHDLRMRLAAQLADALQQLDGGDRSAAALATALRLESDDTAGAEVGAQLASDALETANKRGLYVAAERLCRLLGERGDAAALQGAHGDVAPIVATLESPHPSVRFAAAEAIVAIGPSAPYAGSSRLTKTLHHLATADGRSEAVVAAPQLALAGETAGWLQAGGRSATPFNRGSRAVEAAIASADTELVLLDVGVSLDGVRETLFRLRRSPATQLVPVALLAADGRLADAQRLAEEHERVIAVARLHSQEAATELADRLVGLAPAGWPNAEERQQRAEAARAMIDRLGDRTTRPLGTALRRPEGAGR